uniref:Oleosin high molecular weight isoform n=1 Tax=Linum usitatissimum TaxID=4006 RepID=A0RZK2_LINUS|nr:oleosin high molecular weight isoform [Linum usitatissimum]
MADRTTQPHQVQVHTQHHYPTGGAFGRYEGVLKGGPYHQQGTGSGPSASKVLAVMTALPIGGTLLALAGITLAGTMIGLAITTPIFVICSPVLVPAALLIGFAVSAFLASGMAGLTGLTSLSWFARYLQQAGQGVGVGVPDSFDQAKRRMQDAAGYMGQKTKEVGQEIQRKSQDVKASDK